MGGCLKGLYCTCSRLYRVPNPNYIVLNVGCRITLLDLTVPLKHFRVFYNFIIDFEVELQASKQVIRL